MLEGIVYNRTYKYLIKLRNQFGIQVHDSTHDSIINLTVDLY